MAITVRKATLSDLDQILDIRLQSLYGGEQWRYRYPHYEEFKHDHSVAARTRILEYLSDETGASGQIMLAELSLSDGQESAVDVAADGSGGSGGRYAIGWSVWKLPLPLPLPCTSHTTSTQGSTANDSGAGRLPQFNSNSAATVETTTTACVPTPITTITTITPTPTPTPTPTATPRRDTNAAHVHAFKAALKHTKRTIFDAKFTSARQLFLHNIGTRPPYQRRGAASALLAWGVAVARDEGVPITLFANPVGIPLYRRFGFEALESVEVRVEGELEGVWVTPMVRGVGCLVDGG